MKIIASFIFFVLTLFSISSAYAACDEKYTFGSYWNPSNQKHFVVFRGSCDFGGKESCSATHAHVLLSKNNKSVQMIWIWFHGEWVTELPAGTLHEEKYRVEYQDRTTGAICQTTIKALT